MCVLEFTLPKAVTSPAECYFHSKLFYHLNTFSYEKINDDRRAILVFILHYDQL